MKINRKNIFLTLCLLTIILSGNIFAQGNMNTAFRGIVVDKNNNPLENVSVKIQEKKIESLTDTNGKFNISIEDGDYLILEKEGYKPFIKRVNNDSDHQSQFVLDKYSIYENTIENIGYETQTKRNTVSAISSVSSDVLEKNAVASVDESMNGVLSGLYSIKSGGYKLGMSNYSFFVRGKATNANASPLILVDDIEADISLIDYRDVESVSVLKDATALAIYGMRGANGVILIKTKRGRATDSSISFSVQTGIQKAVKISDRLDAYQYTTLYNEALRNDGQTAIYNPDIYLGDYNPYIYPNSDFKKEFIDSSAPYQNYVFSANGGNNVATYYVSASYLKQEGVFKSGTNNTYERFNFRSNVDVNIRKGLTLGVSAFGSLDANRFPYTGEWARAAIDNVFNQIINTPANAYPIFNEDGSLGGTAKYQTNIYGLLNRAGTRKDAARMLNANMYIKQDLDFLTKGLSVDAYFGMENYNKNYTSIYKKFSVSELQSDGTYTKYGLDDNKNTRAGGLIMNSFYRYMTYGAAVNYDNILTDKHQLNAKLLFNQSTRTLEADNPDIKYQALSFRGAYAYDNKYLAELTASYYGSNNFESGDRFGLFPALGLGWIFSEEDFLKDSKIIDFAKLRATYGINGNDQTNNTRFAYRQTWLASGGYGFGDPNGSKPGSQEGTLGYKGSTWEKAYKFNVGIDMKLLSSFDLSLDYFHEKRKDILVDYSNVVPGLIGVNLPLYNGGQINNQGIELSLGYSKVAGDWQFMAQGNLLWAKNKVIDLKEVDYRYSHSYRKGHPINTRFGFETGGMYTTNEQLANAPGSQYGTPQLGDLIYKNQNPGDDNYIDADDAVALGNAFPELIYNFVLGVNYRDFDFAAIVEGTGNYDVYCRPDQFTPYAYQNRWDPANPQQQTLYPRMSIGSIYNQQSSDFWIDSGRSINLSSIELGYTLPKSLISKIRLSSLRVFVNGNNLYSSTKVKEKRNPEAPNAGYTEIPLLRTFSLGLSIKL